MEEVISLLERFVLNFEDELNEEQLNYIKSILETAKGVNDGNYNNFSRCTKHNT